MRMLDEVDLIDLRSNQPAFMFLRAPDTGDIAIEIDVVNIGGLHLTLSLADARRLAERLAAAADDIAIGR
jgi:hypothetical protein